MGISANQAKFLALTGRQCDLEYRMQNICQRRLNLSSKLTNAANAYNRQTSDRRLFINNIDSYTSSTGTVGDATHENLADNQQYEFISIENLDDNGYYVLDKNGDIITSAGGSYKKMTGSANFTDGDFGGVSKNVGEWFNFGGYEYQITSAVTETNSYSPSDFPTPSPSQNGTPSAQTTSAPTTGTASTGTTRTAWQSSGVTQTIDGQATQIWTRTASTEIDNGKTTTTIPIRQTQVTELGTSTGSTQINGVTFNQYNYTDYLGNNVTAYAIGETGSTDAQKKAQALQQLNALAAAGTIDGMNFILMSDVDMSGQNWGVIDSFNNGSFDGNLHTIENLTYSTSGAAETVGMFGTIQSGGTVKNLNLDGTKITGGAGSYSIGSLAGINFGTVRNVHSLNLDINLSGELGNSPVTDFNNGMNTIGGLIGGNSAIVDKVSAQGSIKTTASSIDGLGSLIGTNGQTSSIVSISMADVDIYTNGGLSCVNTFVGCDAIPGNYANCYTTSMIYDISGNPRPNPAFQDSYYTGHGSSSIKNFYKFNSSGTPIYANGSGSNTISSNSEPTYDSDFIDEKINGLNVWLFSGDANYTSAYAQESGQSEAFNKGTPILNFEAVNTETAEVNLKSTVSWIETYTQSINYGTTTKYTADRYETMDYSEDDLEKNLRAGIWRLATDADMLTQEPHQVGNKVLEYVDWRTAPVINDDLYTTNDEAAEIIYEKTVTELNEQDKKLQLEQKKVETEYTAVTSQKEAVKKILDNNTQSSFKYFG